MFPKHTMTTVVIPPEKPSMIEQKDSAVLYMVENKDIQVAVHSDAYWRTKRATICACVFVLTILILVAGTLGAIAIVLPHNDRVVTSDTPPTREPLLGNALPTNKLSEPTPRVKIDEGGLWLAEPVTPDLVDVEVTDLYPSVLISSSDTDSDSSSSEVDYNLFRNYVSSSFPYDGYYMRGEVGIPPWEQSNWEGSSEVSGDGDEVSGDSTLMGPEYDNESDYGFDKQESSIIDDSSSLSSDDYDSSTRDGIKESSYQISYQDSSTPDNTFSDMYYDS